MAVISDNVEQMDEPYRRQARVQPADAPDPEGETSSRSLAVLHLHAHAGWNVDKERGPVECEERVYGWTGGSGRSVIRARFTYF